MMPEIGIVHYAGVPVNGLQRCAFCGEVLMDYRNAAATLNPDGTTPALSYWKIGSMIRTTGNHGHSRMLEVIEHIVPAVDIDCTDLMRPGKMSGTSLQGHDAAN